MKLFLYKKLDERCRLTTGKTTDSTREFTTAVTMGYLPTNNSIAAIFLERDFPRLKQEKPGD